ncbi:MAG: DUF488 family protein [Terriglobales bacterium]|jgi:uncharacterized protein YeaO (DUF488 family)
MAVKVKRIYEEAQDVDGTRVLVDRLWPRGVSKEKAALDAWLRELAPSDELRQWFHSTPNGWLQFRKRYLKELTRPEAAGELTELYDLAGRRKRLTLLFASKNEDQNNATVLRDLLEGMKKPPTGTGPGAARGARVAKVRAMPKR